MSTLRIAVGLAAGLALASAAWADVSGRVLGPDGQPLAGATLSAHEREDQKDQGERHLAGRERIAVATARSAADGTFRLAASRPFTWLAASADGYVPVLEPADHDLPMTVTLRPAKPRRGTIRAGGKPVSGAVVVWMSASGAERISRTGADGSYEVPEAGGLVVLHPDFAPLRASYEEDEPNAGLDQQLESGIPLTGSVVDAASRKPVAGATVWLDGSWPLAKSDAHGAFRIAHAPRDWSTALARSEPLVGTARKKLGAIVISMNAGRSLSGTVRDEKSGRPLAGASVVAWTDPPGFTASADADASGRYMVTGLPPGRYRAYADRPGFIAGPADWGSTPPIDLRNAASGRLDLALAPMARITGRVQDESQGPVEGALVSLGLGATPNVYLRDLPFAGMMYGAESAATTRTGPDGSFSLMLPTPPKESSGLPKDAPLIVLKPGFAAGRVELKPGAASPLVVTLSRGVELQGRLSGPDGVPLAGVAVTLAEDGTIGGTLVPIHVALANVKDKGWATSDAAGRFTVRVHPVVHDLVFTKPGFAPKTVRGHDPRAGQPLEVVLDLAAVIRGRVARADGSGVSAVDVGVMSMAAMVSESTATAADGAFEIGGLAPGVYELSASNQELGIAESRTVEAPATDVQIVLGPRGTVRGRVIDAATRRPVPRFDVSLEPVAEPSWDRPPVSIDDPAGAFTVPDVPVGEVNVEVSAEGYANKRVEGVRVNPEDEPADLELALERDAPIRGQVTNDGRTPVPEAQVSAQGKESNLASSTSTDEDGQYELRGLAPGEVSLTFEAKGYLKEERTLDTRQPARLDVTLKRGLSLRGEVVRDGIGVPNVHVGARSSAQGASYQFARTDEGGRFTVAGLTPGRYEVSANDGTRRAKIEDVDVERAGSLRLVLDRAPTAILTGKVIGLPTSNDPLFATVMASGEDDASAQAFVDATHSFRMEDAPSGRVTVRAHATSMSGASRTSRSVELTLAAGSQTETVLEFPNDVVINGLVVRDGSPVPYVRVSFSSETANGAEARTDARGGYEAIGLEPGPYQVKVEGEGGVSFATEYAVTSSAQFDIDITGGAVSGRAVRADGGAPLGGVEVSLFRLGGDEHRPVASISSNGQGAFSQRSLREGRYRLITSKAGFGQEVRELEVARGATAEVTLELSPAEGVSVTVVDARDGRPLDAIVVVRDEARRIVANRHSGVDADGVLNIPLASGAYLLSTSASGYGTVTRPVTAPGQGLRIGLTPGGTLMIESERELRGRVRLVQPDGEEYVRCWCSGIADIELKGRRTTVENVTPGSYKVDWLDGPPGATPKVVVIREGQTSHVAFE